MSVEWAELKAAELRALAARGAVVVVPVASIEQHGPHLPVITDSLLCSSVARRGAERAAAQAPEGRPAVVAPTVWSGLSEHHMPFGGTLSLDFPAFSALVGGICRSLQRHGFRRILLLNGHGGNESALHVIVEQLSPTSEAVLATANYWHLAALEFAGILERQSGVRHACEAETSMVLALRPELVDPTRFEEARFEESPSPAGGAYRWQSFADRSASGVLGDPTAASAEKGERLFMAAAEALAALLQNEAFWQRSPRSELVAVQS
jgi:creatinine amidohydrolase